MAPILRNASGMRRLLAIVPVAACTYLPPTVSLGDLDLKAEVDADPGAPFSIDGPAHPWNVSVVLDTGYNTDTRCDDVDDGITASLDGEPLVVAMRNGEILVPGFSPAGTCLPISFVHFPGPTLRSTRPTISTITIVEGDRSWSIQAPALMTHDLHPTDRLARDVTVSFVWPSAVPADLFGIDARVGPYISTYPLNDGKHWQWLHDLDGGDGVGVTVTDNRFELAIGPLDEMPANSAFGVWADRNPPATRCDPPLQCDVWVFDAFAGTI